MSKRPFFSDSDASDRAYVNIRAAENEHTAQARALCEDLWEDFEEHADEEFLREVQGRFDERFWEMYLTVTLIRSGYQVTCPRPGPDVGIVYDGVRIWFEAVCPSRGADGSPDQVPEVKSDGTVQSVPNEKLVLRYLSSISEKYERQLPGWIKRGVVSDSDALVVAINPRRLGFETGDTIPPRILQAAYPIGHAYVTISRETLESTGSGYHIRPNLTKSSGTLVDTGVFLRNGYERLSGLLLSRVDAANVPSELGSDFQLAPSPAAHVPLPSSFRLPGTYFGVEATDDDYRVHTT